MNKKIPVLALLALSCSSSVVAQTVVVNGNISDKETGMPIEYASIFLKENQLWAITDAQGQFEIKNLPKGQYTFIIRSLGYQPVSRQVIIDGKEPLLRFKLQADNLKLKDVEVVAKRRTDDNTTSYIIDRNALDNQQVINVGDISTLLPGGKTINSTLMNDNRLALRSGTGERGNASFGTAIDVDGVRLDNNTLMGETAGASTRGIGSANIESVEVVSGIPSVEYGDLSNGIVKINTRKGKSPFIVEGRINQHTQLYALSKGLALKGEAGLLNFSFEYARSLSDAASPYTAYRRNSFTANYLKVFMPTTTPLTLNVGISGNVGGYKSKADPDNDLNDYAKVRDYQFRGNISLNWLLNKPYLSNLSLKGAIVSSDKQTEEYYNTSSAASQAYIHTRQEGYFVAEDYEANPAANIILGPTGYWYVRRYNDAKPLSWSLNLKANWAKNVKQFRNNLKLGMDYTGSRNNGEGTFYTDKRTTPTWRPYVYRDLPTLHDLSFYIEEHTNVHFSRKTFLDVVVGLRNDNTLLSRSAYQKTASFSPRVNAKLTLWEKRHAWITDLAVHAGWGKSVKLPSFQVLYPAPTYADKLVFTPANTVNNQSYLAYYTHPTQSVYNPDLKWQYSHQTDIGVDMTLLGTHITLSAYYNKTFNPYMATTLYTPFSYKYTSQAALNGIAIPSENRQYSIDPATGIVTVTDKTGAQQPVQLAYKERQTYLTNTTYVNASPTTRMGLEWIVDFTPIKAINTSLRLDGNYYLYKTTDYTLFQDVPFGLSSQMSNGEPYKYIGYYLGANATSTNYTANASVSNGAEARQLNLNATITTRIPRIRMIFALRLESSLYRYSRALARGIGNKPRDIALYDQDGIEGIPYHEGMRNRHVITYPEYYSTWEDPSTKIPFAEKLAWAKEHDTELYNDLTKLIVRSNYPYTLNPNEVSSYFSANLSVTKELGDHVQVSFYANNFFNTMAKVHSSQTDLSTSLFGSGYVPSFYYGLSLKLKL